jgi:replicative DNA helicase/DNA primase catalytic subunit
VAVIRINNTLEDKGVLITPEQFSAMYKEEIQPKANTDWYASLFTFGNEALEHFASKNGSIAGYNGPAYTNNLVFDLDNEDLNVSKADVVKLLTRLAKDIGLGKEGIHNHVRVYFSGNKGFHVFIKTAKQFTPEELKEYCKIIAGDLVSFDAKIYNRTRCFRVANTINIKSGLYKIPVSLELIKDKDAINKIKELAKAPQEIEDNTIPLQDLTLIDNFVNFKKSIKQNTVTSTAPTEEIDGIRGLTTIDFKRGKGIPKCIYALSQGVCVPGKGHRHETMLHLGNYYRNQGHNKVVVENILSGIAELNSNLYPEHERFSDYEIKNSVSKMVFADDNKVNVGGWGVTPDNEVFASYCKAIPGEDKCPIHSKGAKKSIIKVENMALDFASFASDFESNVIPTGIGFVDDKMKIAKGTTTLLVGASGCHRKGEKVLMFDGSVKAVEDVKVNDLIMGPDSSPRTVLELCRGQDAMYEIKPVKGNSFFVNGEHVLSHLNSHNKWTHLTVNKLLTYNENMTGRTLVRTGVEFPKRSVDLDPYILGAWLGDGYSDSANIVNIDEEIIDSIYEYGKAADITIKKHTPNNRTPYYSLTGNNAKFMKMIHKLNLFENKHIPELYKINNRETRLQLLAGLLDTDGSLQQNCFDFVQKRKNLSEDVVFLCRSLGLAAYLTECQKTCGNNGKVGTYYRVSISGNTDIIPTRVKRKQATERKQIKDVLKTGFSINKVADQEDYFGFKVDKDNLYLLEDFTITHNSGKTSLVLSAFEQCSKNNIASVFFSMDMHKNLLFMRLAQRYTDYTANDLFKIYKNHDLKKISEINEMIKVNFTNTYFDFTGNLSIDDIVHRVELIEQENSQDVKLVVIDYASRLTGPHSDTNANEGYNALKSKDAADQTDAAWIILNQVSRVSGDGSTPLRSKRVAKGSSAWEESASNMITVWRPFMSMDGHIDEDGVEYKDDYMRILLAKNRMGEEKETVVRWVGEKGTIEELSESELYDYDRNIKPLEKKVQKAKKFNFGG